MAGVTNREFWDFRVKTRAQFTKLAEQIANIDTSGGGGISELTSKMVVDALGYTPYNANNPANYITSAALAPYLKTEDAKETYATKDYVTTKLVDYAPLTSVQGFENRIGGLEGAVPQLNERVTIVEGKVRSLNETVSTGENNLLDRVNVIEEEYATKTYVDNAIDGIDLSPYLLKADLTKSRIQSTLGISDWALAATKPSYAWSEITSRPTALSQFTDDVVAGKYLPLSGGTLTGSVFFNKHTQFASSAYFYSNVIVENTSYATILFKPNGLAHYLGVSTDGGLFFTNNGWSKTYTILHSGNIGNYNAGSATKLQTARTLWGQSFDGTSDVNGHFVSTGENGGFALYSGIRHNEAVSIERLSASGTRLGLGITLRLGGNVGIGTASPSEKLDVSGNIKASGNINATSITINGVTITASNGSITVNGNVFATGDITGYV